MTLRFVAVALSLAWAGTAAAQMSNFQSLSDAEAAAERIMDASGLRTVDFEVLVDEGSYNAGADMIEIEPDSDSYLRVILYDPEFLLWIESQTDEWGPISVMAHEVAHHLLGHTAFGMGSNPPYELDADFFTGFILNRLGASLEQAQAAMRLIASTSGSWSHPPRDERLDTIELGWNKAREGVVVSADQGLQELKEELRRLEDQLADSEGRFREAEDRFRQAEAERDEALEQFRQAEAEGRLTEERRREMEERIQETDERFQQAEEDREEALTELSRSRNRAEDAMARANWAFVLVVLLVPLVLVALLMSMKRPRQEVARVIERVSSRYVGAGGQRPRGREDGRRSDARPAPGGGAAPGMARPIPPAPPFDGSGLERCAEKGGFVLGRDAYLVDAVLSHASVSRRHARLTQERGRLCIEDLNSANGTWVNGRRIQPFAATVLAQSDAVTLGKVDVPLRLRTATLQDRRL